MMKFEVKLKKREFELKIDSEVILETIMLSEVVDKIEQYLKMRYLPAKKKNLFDKFMEQ